MRQQCEEVIVLIVDGVVFQVVVDGVESLLQLDWTYVIAQRSDWTDRWNKEILGQ